MRMSALRLKALRDENQQVTFCLYPSYSLQFESSKWMQMLILLQANLMLPPRVAHLIAKDLANSVRNVRVSSNYKIDIECRIPAFWRAVVKFFILRFFAFKINLNYIKGSINFSGKRMEACIVNLPCPWVTIQHLACHEQSSLPRALTDHMSPLALLS